MKNPDQIVRLVERILRHTRGRTTLLAAALICLLAVVYGVWLRPYAERSLGVSLPSVLEEDASPGHRDRSTEPSENTEVNAADLLERLDRDRYRSPAGLIYGPGSTHGHRFEHVMAHARDEPRRAGAHGVFEPGDPQTVIGVVDEAYEAALEGQALNAKREGDRTVYTVDLKRRIGYAGGQSGERRGYPPARRLRLVLEGNRLITAFPVAD